MATEQNRSTADATTETKTTAARNAPLLVDLGAKSRKLVRRLRKGKGKLMESVAATVQELQASGQIGPQVQPIIIVVSEKREGLASLLKI